MLRTGRIKFLTITLPKIRIRPLRQMEHSNEWRMERIRHEKEDFQGDNDCSHRGGGVQHYGNRRG